MQTSAKTKAKEFGKWANLSDEMQISLEKLLLEHERDACYPAIDIVNSIEDEVNYDYDGEVVARDKVINLIHNLKVGL